YRGRFAWTSRELDSVTGLQYNRARWYDAATGRWMSQDPMGFAAGDSNLYRYADNNSTSKIDPSGLEPTTDWWAARDRIRAINGILNYTSTSDRSTANGAVVPGYDRTQSLLREKVAIEARLPELEEAARRYWLATQHDAMWSDGQRRQA